MGKSISSWDGNRNFWWEILEYFRVRKLDKNIIEKIDLYGQCFVSKAPYTEKKNVSVFVYQIQWKTIGIFFKNIHRQHFSKM